MSNHLFPLKLCQLLNLLHDSEVWKMKQHHNRHDHIKAPPDGRIRILLHSPEIQGSCNGQFLYRLAYMPGSASEMMESAVLELYDPNGDLAQATRVTFLEGTVALALEVEMLVDVLRNGGCKIVML